MNTSEYELGLHVAGELYSPLQQYSGLPYASHALLQATTPPSDSLLVTRRSDGHEPFKSTTHPVAVQFWPEPPFGVTRTGRLYPSTRLTSKKSSPPYPSRVNSARVVGGDAVFPEQSMAPEEQSPVRQEKELDEDVVQKVLAQKRPPQAEGAVSDLDDPEVRVKPSVGNGGEPALERIPGQTVWSHLFTSVKVVDCDPEIGDESMKMRTKQNDLITPCKRTSRVTREDVRRKHEGHHDDEQCNSIHWTDDSEQVKQRREKKKGEVRDASFYPLFL